MNPRQVNIEASALWYDPETGVGPPWCEVTIYVDGRRYSASEHANGDDALRELVARLRSLQEEVAT